MKKLSLLVALALLITVGGVYATWSYQTGPSTGDHQYYSINMTTATSSGSKGVLTADPSTLKIVIDDTNGDHKPELVVTGEIVITFTPNKEASIDQVVKDEGVDITYNIGMSALVDGHATHIATPKDHLKYLDMPIFNEYDNTPITITKDKLTKAGDAFTYTITAEKIKELIQINGDIELPTHADYVKYGELLATVKYGVAVSEATAAAVEAALAA